MSMNYTRREWLATVGTASLASTVRPLAITAETKPLQGAFIILSTPYTIEGNLHYEDLSTEVDFLDRCGVHGLVWPQNSSEQRYLSKAERLRGMDVIADAARGKQPAVVFGVQADSTGEMLEYAHHAESLNPDGMIAIPPTSARSLKDFQEYYEALCQVTSRPVFIQTSGGAPDVEPTVEFIVNMASEFPNLGYVKEEREPVHKRMRDLAEHRPQRIKRIFGAAFGRAWLYEMRLGTDGIMTGGAMYADIYAQLWELHRSGDLTALRELYSKLLLMLNLDATIPGIRLYMLKRRGIFSTTKSRRGNYSFSASDIAEIEYRWEELQGHLRA